MDMNVSKLQETVKDRKAWHALVHGVMKRQTWLSDLTTTANSWGRTWEPWNGFEQESEMVRCVLGRDRSLATKWGVTERTSCLSWPWHRYILPPHLPDLLLSLQHHLFHDLWPLFWLQGWRLPRASGWKPAAGGQFWSEGTCWSHPNPTRTALPPKSLLSVWMSANINKPVKLPTSFYEATITLIPKPDKDATKKKKRKTTGQYHWWT